MGFDHERLQEVTQLAIVLRSSGRKAGDRAEEIFLDIGQHLVQVIVNDTIL